MPIDNDVIVYSTEHGNLPKPPRSAPQEGSRPPTQQVGGQNSTCAPLEVAQ
jgi:hypothetical protein